MEFLTPYKWSVLVIGLVGLMQVIQLIIADVVALKAKHTPGFPIEATHDSFVFRATRAFMNTNESVSIFILLLMFATLLGGAPSWVNGFSLLYFVARVGHMFFYYINFSLARSGAFGLSLIGLVGLFICGVLTLV